MMKTAVFYNNQYFHTYCKGMLLGKQPKPPGLLEKQYLAKKNYKSYHVGTGTQILQTTV